MKWLALNPWVRAIAAILLGLTGAAFAAAVGCVIAMAGVHQIHMGTIWARVPAYLWHFRYDPQIYQPFLIGAAVALLGYGIAIVAMLRGRRSLFGDADFAKEADIRREDMRAKQGIILGKVRGKYLIFGGTEHVLVEAPTRAGKGVGVVIPNLLSWHDSAVVLDIKQENYAITAGFREAAGQDVFLLDPLSVDQKTACYNPLGYINRTDPIEVIDELQRLAITLFPEGGDNPFWVLSGRKGFAGVGAYLAATPELTLSIGSILAILTDDPLKKLPKIINARQKSGNPLSAACVMLINDFVQNSSDVFSSVKSTITARIGLWVNPRVDYVTSRSDFNLADLRRKRMTIYLGSNPGDLQRLAPLYNLLLQQLVDLNTRTLPEHGGGKIQILIVLDEFKRIGKADVIAAAFSYVAGYGIRLMPVVQSRFQLIEIYGPNVAKEITANCGAEIIYAPKDKDDADYISARLGYQTVKSRSQSRQRASLAANNNSAGSTSTSEQRRALMLPQELTAMPKRLGLIFRAGMPPVLHHKIRYYKDKAMMARVLPPPIVPAYTLPPEYTFNRSALGDGSEDMMVLEDAAVLTETKPLPEFQTPQNMIDDVARISAQITANGGRITPAEKRSLDDSVEAWCVA